MQAYLDRVAAAVRPVADGTAPLYLRTHAIVPDLLHGHDVENHLTPLAQRLPDLPIVLARGTKAASGTPFVEVGLVAPGQPPTWRLEATVAGSAGTKAWKQQLRQAVLDAGVEEAPPGPLAMVIEITCSPRRAWFNLGGSRSVTALGPSSASRRRTRSTPPTTASSTWRSTSGTTRR